MPTPSDTGRSYQALIEICNKYGAQLLAVSKTRTEKEVMALYNKGQRLFGENRAHELIIKASLLPTDIQWHLIGHLQTNKVKSVIQYATCIQSLDSEKLWKKINEEAGEALIKVTCLLQIKIAAEETKYGWDMDDLISVLAAGRHLQYPNVIVTGVMGMATLTENEEQIRSEFRQLKEHFLKIKNDHFAEHPQFNIISMGMSNDFHIALAEGSTMIRIGSLLFN